MSLNNSQYEKIMREYNERQHKNQRLLEQRRKNLYEAFPRFLEIDKAISSASIAQVRRRLEGDQTSIDTLHTLILDHQKEREKLLLDKGYPADYLSPIYTCKECKDTGFIDNQKCRCFKQMAINMVYSQSNIHEILERENFNSFSYEFYNDTKVNPITQRTSLATMQYAVKECRNFIDNFAQKPKNLFLYGDTGVGKTFLSNCVAKELLDQGYSVIYFTAFQLFDILSKGIFDKDTDAIAAHENIFNCDLLIIDDLGTELTNSFTSSQIFLCVNERLLRQKSTIISTNLGMNQIADIYSERTLSRISSNYTIIKLFGDDIRMKKRQMR